MYESALRDLREVALGFRKYLEDKGLSAVSCDIYSRDFCRLLAKLPIILNSHRFQQTPHATRANNVPAGPKGLLMHLATIPSAQRADFLAKLVGEYFPGNEKRLRSFLGHVVALIALQNGEEADHLPTPSGAAAALIILKISREQALAAIARVSGSVTTEELRAGLALHLLYEVGVKPSLLRHVGGRSYDPEARELCLIERGRRLRYKLNDKLHVKLMALRSADILAGRNSEFFLDPENQSSGAVTWYTRRFLKEINAKAGNPRPLYAVWLLGVVHRMAVKSDIAKAAKAEMQQHGLITDRVFRSFVSSAKYLLEAQKSASQTHV